MSTHTSAIAATAKTRTRWASRAAGRRIELGRERHAVFSDARAAFGRVIHLRRWQGTPAVNLFGLNCTQARAVRPVELPDLDHGAGFMLGRRLAVAVSWSYSAADWVSEELAALPDRFVSAVVVEGPTCGVYPTSPGAAYVVADRAVLGDDRADEVIRAFTAGRWSRRPAARQAALNAELETLRSVTVAAA